MTHRTAAELESAVDHFRESPAADGVLELIVTRPAEDEREELEEGTLDLSTGLVGDNWLTRGDTSTPDGAAHPDRQLNIINSRVSAFLAVDPERRGLAGDQLHVDLDLSTANLPAGTRLAIGSAVIEVTAEPHLGCKKFMARFGLEALRFVNSDLGKQLRPRGLSAKVVVPGTIRRGDKISKL